jgi:hypothetical protein
MNGKDTSLPELSKLIEERLGLVGSLAESLELSSGALVRNDAEAIARGAAHQAELCRQWSCLEGKLSREAARYIAPTSAGAPSVSTPSAGIPGASLPEASSKDSSGEFGAVEHSARLQAEWEALSARIRYLTRVHCSLLRHLQRSLAVLERVVDSCESTYTPGPRVMRTEAGPQAGG